LQAQETFSHILDSLSSLVHFLALLQQGDAESSSDSLFESLVGIHLLAVEEALLLSFQVCASVKLNIRVS